MDQLMEQLQSKAGLSPEQAEKAVAVVTEFLAKNMSDEQIQQIAGQIPGIGKYADKLPEGLGDKLGGMFGKRG